jgi:hypothetical protein
MKILVVPDIHNHVEWAEELVAAHPGHLAVFVGDYFDSYGDTPFMAEKTAEWLRYSIQQPGRIHLMGNHDLPYRWRHMNCPGYHTIKGMEVRKHMNYALWQQVRLYHVVTAPAGVRPLVISHAGFTLANLYGAADFRDVARGGRLEFLRERSAQEHLNEIHKQGEASLRAASSQRHHFWFNQGTRMGYHEVGGPFWIDRHETRSELPGIDQIVGHTHVKTPQCHYVPHRAKPILKFWFIDGVGKYAAIVDTGTFVDGGMQITPIHARGEKIGQPVETQS